MSSGIIVNLLNLFFLTILLGIFYAFDTLNKYPVVVILTCLVYSMFILCRYSKASINLCKIVSIQTMLTVYLILSIVMRPNVYMVLGFYCYSIIIYLF